MTIQNPYTYTGQWYRGSLHIHSTFSVCGWHTIDELALAYRDYAFLAVSDHDRITTETEVLRNHVLFRAVEVSGDHHMLLAGRILRPALWGFGLCCHSCRRFGHRVASHAPVRTTLDGG